MKLFEYEAKKIFREFGIPVSPYRVISSPGEGLEFFRENSPAVIKAQVLTGGRGKAGGIKTASTEEEYLEKVSGLLGSAVKGFPVKKLLIEKKLDIRREVYTGFGIDRLRGDILFILSAEGGVDIEELAARSPSLVIRKRIDILEGFSPERASSAVKEAGFEAAEAEQITDTAIKLYELFIKFECRLAEINPLAVTSSGEVIAADARVDIYDEAAPGFPEFIKDESETELESRARAAGLGYVQLSGNIGVIGNGAGLNMATLDILTHFGGRPANFLEVSGRTYHKASEAIDIVISNPAVKVIFGNFFGCISRCDVIAEGLAAAAARGAVSVPMVISMRGTGAEEGVETLKKAGFREIYSDDIEAGRRAAELSRGGS